MTPEVVANLVILNRATEKGKTALLIEGNSDSRFYRRVIDSNACRPFAAGNRITAEAALRILKAHGQSGVLAVVDADTDHMARRVPADEDLLITHTRDLEGILLSSSALKSVLVEFDVDGAFGPDPAATLIEAAVPLGFLRFVVQQKGWDVRISHVDFPSFVDPKNLKCDLKSLCAHLALLTRTPGITGQDYEKELRKFLSTGCDPLHVARGHDVTSILAFAISRVAGRRRKSGAMISAEMVESYLRTAYPEGAFRECELFGSIRKWEQRNCPFKVLKS